MKPAPRLFRRAGFIVLINTLHISMYSIEVLTPPTTEPVSVSELKAQLRLNDDSEDSLLAGYIKTAREFFESYTMRAVHPTMFRQHSPFLDRPIYLMRNQVRAINTFKYWDTNNTLQTISTYNSDVISTPGNVWLSNYPTTSTTKCPVAYVEYSAGWDTDKVPSMVSTGIRLLAAHYYEFRNSHQESELKDVPMGFRAVCDQFKTGAIGYWGFSERLW
jgi:uncharacterized phiE125 gp8 family phage protein